jgi:hypothetical protein
MEVVNPRRLFGIVLNVVNKTSEAISGWFDGKHHNSMMR